jgi:hypothetical protein
MESCAARLRRWSGDSMARTPFPRMIPEEDSAAAIPRGMLGVCRAQAASDRSSRPRRALARQKPRPGDVDDSEHLNPKQARPKDRWLKTMNIGGLPWEWAKLDHAEKDPLRSVIQLMRELGSSKS